MKHLFRGAIGAAAVAAAVLLATPANAGASMTGSHISYAETHWCGVGVDYSGCVSQRSEFKRYYQVSEIRWSSWGTSYYFEFW
ncbi:hypothetical protein GCM10010412_088440 [Nonomuraea recticatena]|uniref:Secreted protein n=1 Tax=Nonomuraea recticatena TaxID=46178 RepID=A0ABN3T8X7_9ACTN